MSKVKRRVSLGLFLTLVLMPLAYAQAGTLSNAFETFFRLMSSTAIVFGLTFIFMLVLLYGIFAAALSYVTVFGSGGAINRYGKMVALSLAVISDIGLMFVIAASPSESVERVLRTMGTFGMIGLSLLIFALTYINLKGDKKTWPVTLLGVGTGMLVFGMLSDSPSWFAWGWLFIIIGVIWFILSGNSSSSEEGISENTLGGMNRSQGPPQTEQERINNEIESRRIGTIKGRVINAVATIESGMVSTNESAAVLANPRSTGVVPYRGDEFVRVKRRGHEQEIMRATIGPDGCFIIDEVPLYRDIIVFVNNPNGNPWTHLTPPFGRPDSYAVHRYLDLLRNRTEENVIVSANPPPTRITPVDIKDPPPPIPPPIKDPITAKGIAQIKEPTPQEKKEIDKIGHYIPSSPLPPGDEYTTITLAPWFFHAENQGDIGACVSFAGGSMREFIVNYDNNTHLKHQMLSKFFLYWKVRQDTDVNGIKSNPDEGSSLFAVAKELQQNGCCKKEKYFNDDPARFSDNPPTDALQDAPLQKITGYKVVAKDPRIWIRTLLDKKPLLFGMPINQSFLYFVANARTQVYSPDSGNPVGRHAMVIVGYNSHKNLPNNTQGPAFLIRNSWGAGWGFDGYAWVEADFLLNGVNAVYENLYVFTDATSDGPAKKDAHPMATDKVVSLINELNNVKLDKSESLAWHDDQGKKEKQIEKIITLLKGLEGYSKYLDDKNDEDKMIDTLVHFLKDVVRKYHKRESVQALKKVADEQVNRYITDIEEIFLKSRMITHVDGKVGHDPS